MNAIPNIIVQLIHIEGPLKGEIQELSDPEIVIGRHPDCQVQFPKEVVTLSRRHARIVREGNRFKLIDQSTNGTFLNGKQVPEAYLKDGDVIMFSEGGPKISFLTQISDAAVPTQTPPAVPRAPVAPVTPQPATVQPPPAIQPPVQPAPAAAPAPPVTPVAASPQPIAATPSGPAVQTAKVPFAIQYGPALKSFQTLPITIGKGAGSDFIIDHPAISAQQVQFFFAQDQYWIKDLTGTNSVTINGMPIAGQAALQPDVQIALSPQGPLFRFLGGGRLAEVEQAPPAASQASPQAESSPVETSGASKTEERKSGGLFKKFFSS
jgi:pSer/pThr/pTyr-binding forkhead associated (FHA) protein